MKFYQIFRMHQMKLCGSLRETSLQTLIYFLNIPFFYVSFDPSKLFLTEYVYYLFSSKKHDVWNPLCTWTAPGNSSKSHRVIIKPTMFTGFTIRIPRDFQTDNIFLSSKHFERIPHKPPLNLASKELDTPLLLSKFMQCQKFPTTTQANIFDTDSMTYFP